jgi:hypothetical protein
LYRKTETAKKAINQIINVFLELPPLNILTCSSSRKTRSILDEIYDSGPGPAKYAGDAYFACGSTLRIVPTKHMCEQKRLGIVELRYNQLIISTYFVRLLFNDIAVNS